MSNKSFVKQRICSFKFALKGIKFMLLSQHNAWIHLFFTIMVIVFGIWLNLSRGEWATLVFAMGLVWMAETFNTALERLTDLVSPEYNKLAGQAKDLAAGAVLITAIAAAVIGILVFLPKIFNI
jgi:diacylglycerol kinase (ATP)